MLKRILGKGDSPLFGAVIAAALAVAAVQPVPHWSDATRRDVLDNGLTILLAYDGTPGHAIRPAGVDDGSAGYGLPGGEAPPAARFDPDRRGRVEPQSDRRSPARNETASSPEARAVAYLAREVPLWRAEHPCYSCHNNGDATRALLVAGTRGHDTGAALEDTLRFLNEPSRWDQNKARGGDDDKPLARLQFASALATSQTDGSEPVPALVTAARMMAGDQNADGSWTLDASRSLGSPATYGTALATWSARTTLVRSGRGAGDPAVAAIDRWMRTLKVANVLDAAAVVLGLGLAHDEAATAQRRHCLGILREGQADDGGWGPYVTAAPQVFDTAVVLLALEQFDVAPALAEPAYGRDELRAAIARGRSFLVSEQLPDGSWIETTRPANQESYAQRVSTTAWALLALFATSS